MAEARIAAEVQRLISEEETLKRLLKQSAVNIKMMAEAMERERKTHMVDKLAGMTEEIISADVALTHHMQALQRVTEGYQHRAEADDGEVPVTDWQAAIEAKVAEMKGAEDADIFQNHRLMNDFKRAVWAVNHPTEPMPGEEEEELTVMTHMLVKNDKCPITLHDVTRLDDAVCCSTCRHIYSKAGMLQLLQQTRRANPCIKCPVSGCQSSVRVSLLVNDEELQMALSELRVRQMSGTGTMGTAGDSTQEVEDI